MLSILYNPTTTSRGVASGGSRCLSPRQVSAVTYGRGPSCLLPIQRQATPQQADPSAPTWEDLLGRR